MVITWAGIMKCSTVPLWCDVYWGIMGPPKVLIAYGFDGLGNPDKLSSLLEDKFILGIRPVSRQIDSITQGSLRGYDLVIVTRSKTMSAEQLAMFYDYASGGGRLVWTGDSGTMAIKDEKNPKDYNIPNTSQGWTRVTSSPQGSLENIQREATGYSMYGWIRVIPDGKNYRLINFNELISADYIDNFCNITTCFKSPDFVGQLRHNEDSIISQDIKQNAPLSGDFAVVRLINNTTTKLDLFANYGANLRMKNIDQTDLGQNIPIIITTGVGDKVIYSAVPLEYYMDSKNEQFITSNTGMGYASIIENIYNFMIGRPTYGY